MIRAIVADAVLCRAVLAMVEAASFWTVMLRGEDFPVKLPMKAPITIRLGGANTTPFGSTESQKGPFRQRTGR